MALEYDGQRVGAMMYNGHTISEAMIDGQIVYRSGPPVVRITATTYQGAFVQFRDALAAYELDAATVEHLPFQLDTSQATDLSWMFVDCLALKTVPPMDLSNVTSTEAMFWSCNALESVPDLVTGNVVNAKNMFQNCVSLTDGNVRLLGRHPNVDTTGMLNNAALTRQPWYSADGLRALVTPVAPTFLDAAPWIVLPDQEGVTYSVQGTPGWGASITITAQPEPGYQLDGQVEWEHQYETTPPVMITGTSGTTSRDQFRQACVDHGTTYDTVVELPFQLDTSTATILAAMFRGCAALTSVPQMDISQVTNMNSMFDGCAALTSVPQMDTSQVTNMNYMFYNCAALYDGNVHLIGKHPNVSTTGMLTGSGLTREPFYDAAGNPI